MPLGSSRPRRNRLSSTGSDKDALYEQLLVSLTQGGEPLATEEEYGHWLRDWGKSHPGQEAPLSAMPRPIQRYRALRMLEFLAWERVERFWAEERAMKVHFKDKGLPYSSPLDDDPMLSAETKEELRARWEEWRKAPIEDYRLDSLVTH